MAPGTGAPGAHGFERAEYTRRIPPKNLGLGPAWPGRSPAWVGGLNVPGYHRHFLSDDRTVGGHVLDCRAREGRVQPEVCRDWLIK